jgi:hypothetical protein
MSRIRDCEDTRDTCIECCDLSSCTTDERHTLIQKATVKDMHKMMGRLYKKLVAWDCDRNRKLCRSTDGAGLGGDLGVHMKEYKERTKAELVARTCLIQAQEVE